MRSDPFGVAGAVDAAVRVVFLGVDAAVVDNEFEGVVHEAAIAAGVVGPVAVDEFLLRKLDQFAGGDLVYAFHRRHRRERPATPCRDRSRKRKVSVTFCFVEMKGPISLCLDWISVAHSSARLSRFSHFKRDTLVSGLASLTRQLMKLHFSAIILEY